MSLDDDLQRLFKRKPAPPDFADRLRARIEQTDGSAAGRTSATRRLVGSRSDPTLGGGGAVRWVAAAAVIALVATGGARYYVYQQTAAEAERVKAEIRIAFQITGEKLALAQRRVQE